MKYTSHIELTNLSSPSHEENTEISSNVYYHIPPPPPPRPIPIIAPSTHHPEPCICPICHQSIVTRIKKTNGVLVWLAALVICFLGFALGCCLIPFFVDGFKDTIHYCPNCHNVIGRTKRL